MDLTMQMKSAELLMNFLRHDTEKIPLYGFVLQKERRKAFWFAYHVFHATCRAFQHIADNMPCDGFYCKLRAVDAPLYG